MQTTNSHIMLEYLIEHNESDFAVAQDWQLYCLLQQSILSLGKCGSTASFIQDLCDLDFFTTHVCTCRSSARLPAVLFSWRCSQFCENRSCELRCAWRRYYFLLLQNESAGSLTTEGTRKELMRKEKCTVHYGLLRMFRSHLGPARLSGPTGLSTRSNKNWLKKHHPVKVGNALRV